MSHSNTKLLTLNGWHQGFSFGFSFEAFSNKQKSTAEAEIRNLFDFIYEHRDKKGLLKLLKTKNLNCIDKKGNGILHFINTYFASRYDGSADKAKLVLEYLLSNKLLNVNLQNFSGENVLHVMNTTTLNFIGEGTSKLLVTSQNVNAFDATGETPIFKKMSMPEMFGFLLKNGANILHTDSELNTVAHKNIKTICKPGYQEVLEMAVEILNLYSFNEYSMMFSQKNKENITPFQLIEMELLNPKSFLDDDTKNLLSSIKTKVMITKAFEESPQIQKIFEASKATSKNKI